MLGKKLLKRKCLTMENRVSRVIEPKIKVLNLVKLLNKKIRKAQVLKVHLEEDSINYAKIQGYINALSELKRDIKSEFHDYFSSEDLK